MFRQYRKEDMQDDTFNLLYKWLYVASLAMFDKDAPQLLNSLWCIFFLMHPRMSKDQSESFRDGLEKSEQEIYSNIMKDPKKATKEFERIREVGLMMTQFLYKQGISLTAKVNIDSLVTQRSDE